MTTPYEPIEKEQFKAFERKIQKQMDIFYKQSGYIIRRDGCKAHDLLIDNTPVEEKIRSEKRADILVEIIQDMVTFNPGWLYTTKAETLNYIMCQDGLAAVLYKIFFPGFKRWLFDTYFKKHWRGIYIISFRGWGLTLNIPIKIWEIPDLIIQEVPIIEQLKF